MPDYLLQDSLFLELRHELCRFLRRRLDPHTAQDVAHDTFLRWRQEARTYIRDPRAFLFTVALNLIRDHERCEARQRHRCVSIEDVAELPGVGRGPDDICASIQQIDRLRAALDELAPPVRDAFLLHRYDGMTQAEIASRLGLSKRTVERHLRRAIVHCLEVLAS